MALVRVTRSPVTVDAAVTLEEGPRSCSATMHEAFGKLARRAKAERVAVPRIEVHVVKLPRRRRA
jgi:hypothetical protein